MEKDKQENEIKLPEAVAKIYKPVPGAVRKYYVHKIGHVDLNKISPEVAKQLVEKGILALHKEEKKV